MTPAIHSRMVPFYLLLTCLLSATYARAVEHPRRNFRSTPKSLSVTVNRRHMTMTPYEPLYVKCRVKITDKHFLDITDIYFGIQYNHRTVVPLSGSFPGVRISPSEHVISKGKNEHMRITKSIRLNPIMYRFLSRGRNVFFCRANSHSPDGKSSHGSAYFTVQKF